MDWSAYELWSKVGSHKHVNASGPLTCPFAPSARGSTGPTAASGGPADAPAASSAEPAALVCPYAPAGARSGPAGAAAASETDRIHVTRTATGLTKLKLVLESPDRCMDPRMVHALGNILLDCLTNAAVTAVLWTITAVVHAQEQAARGDCKRGLQEGKGAGRSPPPPPSRSTPTCRWSCGRSATGAPMPRPWPPSCASWR